MPPRLFFDANVLFTAAISPDGVSRKLFDLAKAQECTALSSVLAIDEAQRNIRAKRPKGTEAMKAIEELLEVVPEADKALFAWAARHLPNKDAPILAAAIAASADILVTGDRRHFGAFYGQSLQQVTILTPRAALEKLLDL